MKAPLASATKEVRARSVAPSGDPGFGRKVGGETEVRCAFRILSILSQCTSLVGRNKKPRRRARWPWP